MSLDWSLEFALFEAAYPGRDWHKMSYARFRAHLDWADTVHAIIRGEIPEHIRRKLDVNRANNQILLQGRFPLFYKPLDFDEDDEDEEEEGSEA